MLQLLGHYYGIDLVGTVFSIFGVYMLGEKNPNPNGFVICVIGNVLWVFIGVLTASVGLVIVNLALGVLNARGYFAWRNAHV